METLRLGVVFGGLKVSFGRQNSRINGVFEALESFARPRVIPEHGGFGFGGV